MSKLSKEDFTALVSSKIRLVRNEYNFSQEKMAELIGVSKKTLIQIEKDRLKASWTVVLAICGLFRESEILKMTLGEDPVELIEMISFEHLSIPKSMTGGGKMFWKTVIKDGKFHMQKNLISNHYRIIDGNGKRWVSSYNKAYVEKEFELLLRRGVDYEEETQ
ncbi:MAG: helix-turn-helix transcriptional regulator [Candidatus Izemoplasmataceae bacterium]|jgi:DNA-binding XRE family transcriptional regulator